MLETEFIRSLQSNYERVHLQDRPDEQRYQDCILTRGGIRGLLPCSLRYINGEAYFQEMGKDTEDFCRVSIDISYKLTCRIGSLRGYTYVNCFCCQRN